MDFIDYNSFMFITIFGAFIAGLVSFLSPCVLPIIPGFLAYLAGAGSKRVVDDGNVVGVVNGKIDMGPKQSEIFINSVFFVLGFSVVFALLGVLLNTVLHGVSYQVQEWLARIGGLIVIFFGLFLVGLIHIPFLEREYKIGVKKKFNSKYLTSFLFGLAFAAGWTPCVGPALGVILGLAASAPTQAFTLLLITVFISKYATVFKYINIVFGIILIALGVLVFTQSLTLIGNVLPVQWIVNRV